MEIRIPTGAIMAGERAYANITPERRRDPSIVVAAIAHAVAPYMTPVLAQLGRGRVSPDAARAIFGAYLRGQTVSHLSEVYGVTGQTIRNHIRRTAQGAARRYRYGTPLSRIAAEYQCSAASLAVVLSDVESGRASHGA
jgi:hypothetical protein